MQSIVSHQVFILPWSRMSQQSHWRHADIRRTQNGRINGSTVFQLVLGAADCFSVFEGRSCHLARSRWGKKRPLLSAGIRQIHRQASLSGSLGPDLDLGRFPPMRRREAARKHWSPFLETAPPGTEDGADAGTHARNTGNPT